ncbi:YncE family protein [Fibrella sp. HMF5335]|uniref:YncE family protein n=1 Tax=Fibrella rubiginis TaxID=2817060 RepID=A0A939GG00_9BACT|nr:YncE family protein [Fibrella rubiginis]MBO0935748.1 YncE family protein [Fibrella rubiginis]
MINPLHTRFIYSWLVLLPLLTLSGCTMHHMDTMKPTQPLLAITYPAAYVVNAETNTLSVIDLATQQVRETITLGNPSMAHTGGSTTDMVMWPHHVYLSPDGTKLGIGVPGMDLSAGHAGGMNGMTGRILVVNPKTGETTTNKTTPIMNHNAVFSPDGTEIWTSQMAMTGKVLVYDAGTMAVKKTIDVGMEPAEVTVSANGQYAFVANGMSNSVSVVRIADKSVVKTLPVGADPVGAWPGADGNMYVDNETGQSISVINVAALSVTETVSLGFTPGYAAYNAVRNELWVSQARTGNRVVIFERRNNQWLKAGEVITGLDAHAIAFTKDGGTAYVTNQGAATVSVIDVATRTKKQDIAVGKKPNGIVLAY